MLTIIAHDFLEVPSLSSRAAGDLFLCHPAQARIYFSVIPRSWGSISLSSPRRRGSIFVISLAINRSWSCRCRCPAVLVSARGRRPPAALPLARFSSCHVASCSQFLVQIFLRAVTLVLLRIALRVFTYPFSDPWNKNFWQLKTRLFFANFFDAPCMFHVCAACSARVARATNFFFKSISNNFFN
jgi:hypothetical protein